ncbi:hypothetical protein JQN72_08085 [Phycicoccus sp. CSK15P-2]|uniref:hypothetical protein n=1 Tax=Phycicoccus sp. CSK15P-2 TaxID=2807627 RepID=UPI001950ECE9|nr:hypothetical protein [Phycicoccus sp. CSK15P-2]MBM6404202.1 hypothetical protein [Phycicoccus sp. CSK15P-2]
MSHEMQVLIFDSVLGEGEVPTALATVDDVASSESIRAEMAEFAADVSKVRHVTDVDVIAGRAVLVTAPPEHIRHVAEYCVSYRPEGSTVVDPVSYAVLSQWTDVEETFEEPPLDSDLAERLQRVFEAVSAQLGATLTATSAVFGPPALRQLHDGLSHEWRHGDESRLLVVEVVVSVFGPRVSIVAAECPRASLTASNTGRPQEDHLTPTHCTVGDLEAMDNSRSWEFAIASPTWDHVLAAACIDLATWIDALASRATEH